MWNLYGIKGDNRKLAATFDSEAQLRSYVQWAILKKNDDGTFKFEQKTPLTGCTAYEYDNPNVDETSLEEKNANPNVVHNPSPGML